MLWKPGYLEIKSLQRLPSHVLPCIIQTTSRFGCVLMNACKALSPLKPHLHPTCLSVSHCVLKSFFWILSQNIWTDQLVNNFLFISFLNWRNRNTVFLKFLQYGNSKSLMLIYKSVPCTKKGLAFYIFFIQKIFM